MGQRQGCWEDRSAVLGPKSFYERKKNPRTILPLRHGHPVWSNYSCKTGGRSHRWKWSVEIASFKRNWRRRKEWKQWLLNFKHCVNLLIISLLSVNSEIWLLVLSPQLRWTFNIVPLGTGGWSFHFGSSAWDHPFRSYEVFVAHLASANSEVHYYLVGALDAHHLLHTVVSVHKLSD